jgi:hypothetical protein
MRLPFHQRGPVWGLFTPACGVIARLKDSLVSLYYAAKPLAIGLWIDLIHPHGKSGKVTLRLPQDSSKLFFGEEYKDPHDCVLESSFKSCVINMESCESSIN